MQLPWCEFRYRRRSPRRGGNAKVQIELDELELTRGAIADLLQFVDSVMRMVGMIAVKGDVPGAAQEQRGDDQ